MYLERCKDGVCVFRKGMFFFFVVFIFGGFVFFVCFLDVKVLFCFVGSCILEIGNGSIVVGF